MEGSESSISVPAQLAELTEDLSLPQAQDPETRLRILTIQDAGSELQLRDGASRVGTDSVSSAHFVLICNYGYNSHKEMTECAP